MRPKISDSFEGSYLAGHLAGFESGFRTMEAALGDDDAKKFVDGLVQCQLHEYSLICGARKMMKRLDFTEEDICMRNIQNYEK